MAQLPCLFAVFFARSGRFQPPTFPRTEIVQFIRQGGFFIKEPRCKPSAKSSEINEPQWFTMEIRTSTSELRIGWDDCNHGYPYSLDPMRDMAQGMLLDAQADDAALLKKITDATDAICIHADLTPEFQKLLDSLKSFLVKRLNGIVFEPGQGFFDDNLQPVLKFPKKAHFVGPQGTLVFGNPKAHFEAMALSPDGKTVGTAGDPGNKASLWNAQTGQLKATLVGHKKVTRSVAFTPDGLTVATGSQDKSIIL